MIKPLHIATVGGQPLRFFKTPLNDGRPDMPNPSGAPGRYCRTAGGRSVYERSPTSDIFPACRPPDLSNPVYRHPLTAPQADPTGFTRSSTTAIG